MGASKLIGYDGIFATRLRELMKSSKATQQDVAAAVGTTRQAISQYADGSVQPNIEKLYKMAEYFNVSADYLLGLSSIPSLNVDDKMIAAKLGLSQIAINQLTHETNAWCEVFNEDDMEKVNSIRVKSGLPLTASDVINTLLEEDFIRMQEHTVHRHMSIITLLGDLFSCKEIDDSTFPILLSTVKVGESGKLESTLIPHQNVPLEKEDVLAIQLLKLQQAIIRYKTDIENRKREEQ